MIRLAQALLSGVFPLLTAARNIYRRIMRPITIGVRALIVDDHQVVLMRTHGSNVWDLPGGGVRRGETLRTAAIREAREETGCDIEICYLLGVYLGLHDYTSDHVAVYVCRARNAPVVGLNLEIAEACWWPLNALPPSVPPATRRRLEEYRAGQRGIEGAW
jgi:ADP-ribose pyrophosphatase YjhB (NUDIX family)